MRRGTQNTKRNHRGRGFALLLALALIVGMMPMQVGAANGDITVTGYTYTGSPLGQDETFQLQNFKIKNNTGALLTNVTMDFSGAAGTVVVSGGSPVISLADLAIGAEPTLNDTALRFVGDGYLKQIPVLFRYTKGGNPDSSTVNLIFDTVTAATPTPTEVDTSKYKPTLSVEISGANFTDAGLQNELRLLIKNTNPSYAAKNVMLALPESNTSPFTAATFGNTLPIGEIKAGGSVEIPVTLTTDDYAKAGPYKLPLSMTWANVWGNGFDASVSLPVAVLTAKTPGLLSVEVGTPSPAATAGGIFSLPVTIRNLGSMPVSSVQVTVDGLTAEGLMLATGSSRISIDRIDGSGLKTVTLQMKAGTALKAGSYPVGFKLAYQDAKGTKTEDTQQLWVPVGGAGETDSTIDVVSITPSKTTINPGDTVSVSVVVKNTGTTEAKQIKVTGEVAAEMFFPTSQNLFILKSLKPGEEKKLTFSYQAQADAKRGSAPVTLKVEVPVAGGTPLVMSQAVSVFIQGNTDAADAKKNVPKIIIYSYAADPGLVNAGSEFTLKLAFMNTHASKSVRNIKANFTVNESSNETGNVFTPVGASNTFYMDAISPKSTEERSLRLYTIPDAKTKTYNVTVAFEYEDEDGNPYTSNEIIGIPVYQPARFELSEPNYMTDTMVGQPMSVSFEMYNLGKNPLYNVKMKVVTEPEGILEVQPKSQYFGNLEAGRNEYVEISCNPTMPGDVKGKVIVTYESASGEVTEAVNEFFVKVAEMPMPEIPTEIIGSDGKPIPLGPDGLPLPVEDKGFFQNLLGSLWGKIAIGAVALILIAAVVVILLLRKKKREKGLEF